MRVIGKTCKGRETVALIRAANRKEGERTISDVHNFSKNRDCLTELSHCMDLRTANYMTLVI
jgi:hypothetical protein